MRPMTEKERVFAEENHNLIYQFLKANDLPEDQYYDIVVFGFLQAVQDYCANSKTQKYQFSTIAWRKMNCSVLDHRRYLASQKRGASTVSIHDPISEDSVRRWEDVLHDDCDALKALQAEMALPSLALTPKERRITRMKRQGESMHAISKAEHMTFRQINSALDKVKKHLMKAIYLLIWRLL